jgi:hypothetical protein
MQEETPIARRQDKLACADVIERTGLNFREVAWPQGGEHAFAVDMEAQTSSAAQDFNG